MQQFFKKFLAIIIISALSWSTAQKTWIQISYEINKLEIIQKFCINKEKTTFKCDGKCHLKDQILEVDENKKKPFQNVETEQKIQLFFSLEDELNFKPQIPNLLNISKPLRLAANQYIQFVFRPPQFN